MNPDRWERIKELFEQVKQQEPQRRVEFLRQACGGDEQLYGEVGSLLASDAQAGEFLAEPPTGQRMPAGLAGDRTETLAFSPRAHGAADAGLARGTLVASRYEILDKLGEGGMGAVYKCRDRDLDRTVALKVIRPALASQPELLRRFKQELILSRQVTHRNVIRIFDLGAADGVQFITMEYVEGRNLASQVKGRGRLSPAETAAIVVQVCLALEAAHAEKIVHRDLKPENIMVDESGKVTVMDFGIARAADGLNYTQTGAVIGTPAYMSPEQARAETVGPASDLFSLGIIFYELLTGVHPFPANDLVSGLLKRVEGKFTPPTQVEPAVPRELAAIVSKCLAADPANRWGSARAMRRAVEAWQVKAGVAHPDVEAPPARVIRGRMRWGAAALALVAGVAGLVWWRWNPQPVGPPKPITLLVADFDNSTSESVFTGTLESAVSIALESAPFISLYDRGDAHRVATQIRAGNSALDASTARLVAVREGIGAVVAGSLARQGSGYRFDVRVLDPLSGKAVMHAEDRPGDKEAVLAAAGRLAAPVRRALGDTVPESVAKTAAETFTSSSIEAAHAYSSGQDFFAQGHWAQAIQSYSEAVRLDPNMGRAYAGLALAYANQGDRQQADKYYRSAMAQLDRMTDREKYRTLGGYYLMMRNPKAIEEYDGLLSRYPADRAAPGDLALAYFYQHDFARALTQGNRALALFPKSLIKRENAGLFALYAGDFEQATAQFRNVQAGNPAYAKAQLGLGMARLAQGHVDEAAEIYKKLQTFSGAGPSLGNLALADLALYEGRVKDAMELLENGARQDEEQKRLEAAAIKLVTLAQAQLAGRRTGEAVNSAERAVAMQSDERIAYPAAQVYLRAGQREKAAALARRLAEGLEPDARAYARLIEGEIKLETGAAAEAIQSFEAARHESDTWLGHLDSGIAYLKANRPTEAYTELQEALRRRGEALSLFLDDNPTFHWFPVTYYYLGLAQEGLRSPAAADSWRTFLAIKNKAEGDALAVDAGRRLREKK